MRQNNKQTLARQESQRLFLEYLIDFIPNGKREFMMADLRDHCGYTRNMTEDYLSAFMKIGLIRKSNVWKKLTKRGRTFGAQHTTVEFVDHPDQMRANLEAAFAQELKTGETIVRSPADDKQAKKRLAPPVEVAIAKDDDEEVRAIAGEDQPNTMREVIRGSRTPDEVAALVAAARQYQGRQSTLDKAFEDFRKAAEAAGATIDVDLGSLIQMDKDDQLETISKVMPYIDQLERMVERLANDNAKLNQQLSELNKLQRENRSLSEQNKRLIAVNMQLRQAN